MNGSKSEPTGTVGGKEASAKNGSSTSIFLPNGLSPINPGSVIVPIYRNPGSLFVFRLQCRFFAYAVAVVAVGGAVVAALLLGPTVKHTPTLFFCSVVLSSWFGGVGPGIFAGLLSMIALDYFFIPPLYALGISLEEAPDIIAFVASAVFVSWLSRGQKRATRSAKHVHGDPDTKIDGQMVKPGTTNEPSQTEASGEPTDPIGHETNENIGEVQQMSRESKVQTPTPENESVFLKEGDYWTIQYQGQIVRLKATRGLEYLASLLGHPYREFHVLELAAPLAEARQILSARFHDAGPILDCRAKAEYASRRAELQAELEEAERLNDTERLSMVQQEMDCIADQLAAAVGLGGRSRKARSDAERARSAVTKRIKDSIHRITEVMPSLGHHLCPMIKTGYFCSYNPHPDRPVKWKLRTRNC
jgi:hypothetical protein